MSNKSIDSRSPDLYQVERNRIRSAPHRGEWGSAANGVEKLVAFANHVRTTLCEPCSGSSRSPAEQSRISGCPTYLLTGLLPTSWVRFLCTTPIIIFPH